MIQIMKPKEIEAMKPAGKFVAQVLYETKKFVKPGTNLLQIDSMVKDMIKKKGAESCYVDYAPSFGEGPFAHYICTSVNDAVLHGLPYDYKLKKGDLLSLDFACSVDGWVSDSAISFIVGQDSDSKDVSSEDLQLIEATEIALDEAIKVAVIGNRIGDISWTIGEVMYNYGYEVNLEFGGHGVGKTMHQDPHVPNDDNPNTGYKLKEGLVIAIEPWICATTDEIVFDKDGWTIRSSDGSNTAHTEHTIAITKDGPLVLTDRSWLEDQA